MKVYWDDKDQYWHFESKQFGFSIPELTDAAFDTMLDQLGLSFFLDKPSQEMLRKLVHNAKDHEEEMRSQ